MHLRNNAAWLFTSSHEAPRNRSSIAGFMRDWIHPAAIFLIWIATLAFTASQLVTVGPTLRAIPDSQKTMLPRPARASISAKR